jgi:hypothetical protein
VLFPFNPQFVTPRRKKRVSREDAFVAGQGEKRYMYV